MIIRSVAPGKIFIAGEYVGIFGKPVILTAIGKFTVTKIDSFQDEKIKITSSYFPNEAAVITTAELISLWELAKNDYKEYSKTTNVQFLRKYRESNLSPALLAVARAISFGNDLQIIGKKGLQLEIESDLPIGCGLGSSASLCASIIGGIVAYFNLNIEKHTINQLVFETEQVLNGRPSGGDNSAVVYGGWISYQKNDKSPIINEINSSINRNNWWIIDGGKPEESSLELINKVVTMSKDKPETFHNLIVRDEKIIENVQLMMTTGDINYGFLNDSHLILEEMGVVGEWGKKLVRKIWEVGGYAKVSGAGGISKGVGTILVYLPDEKLMEKLSIENKFTYQKIRVGEIGWHIQK